MTDRQREIYDYIRSYISEKQYSPTIREIGEAVKLKSSSTVHSHLKKMKEDGYIDFVESLPRTLRIVA